MFRTGSELDFASSSPLYSNPDMPGPDPVRLTISGVLRDSHLRGAGGGLLGSGFGVVEGFSPAASWASSGNDGGPAGPGSVRPAPGGMQLHPPLFRAPRVQRRSRWVQGRGRATALGFRSVSCRSAAMAPGSDVVQCRLGVGAPPQLLIFLFHGRRAEAAGRKEGRKKTRGGRRETEFRSGG